MTAVLPTGEPLVGRALRLDMKREDGTFRDTVVFSVQIDERAEVKAGLRARLRV